MKWIFIIWFISCLVAVVVQIKQNGNEYDPEPVVKETRNKIVLSAVSSILFGVIYYYVEPFLGDKYVVLISAIIYFGVLWKLSNENRYIETFSDALIFLSMLSCIPSIGITIGLWIVQGVLLGVLFWLKESTQNAYVNLILLLESIAFCIVIWLFQLSFCHYMILLITHTTLSPALAFFVANKISHRRCN